MVGTKPMRRPSRFQPIDPRAQRGEFGDGFDHCAVLMRGALQRQA